jgi:mRNA-degrading endonuclease RelE of RelBE toxin-antitoxin system
MRVSFAPHFLRSFGKAPSAIQERFNKQLESLLKDIRHPSLRVKIVDPQKRIWQARVNGGWRFYFQVRGDTYYLLEIIPHPQ